MKWIHAGLPGHRKFPVSRMLASVGSLFVSVHFSFEFWFVTLVRLFVDSTNVAEHIQSLAKYNHSLLRS